MTENKDMGRAARFLPHLIVLASVILLVVAMIGLNSNFLGVLLGGMLGAILDVPVSIVALVFGGTVSRHRTLLLGSLAISVAATLLIHWNNSDFAGPLKALTFVHRFMGFVFIAYLANFFRVLAGK